MIGLIPFYSVSLTVVCPVPLFNPSPFGCFTVFFLKMPIDFKKSMGVIVYFLMENAVRISVVNRPGYFIRRPVFRFGNTGPVHELVSNSRSCCFVLQMIGK